MPALLKELHLSESCKIPGCPARARSETGACAAKGLPELLDWAPAGASLLPPGPPPDPPQTHIPHLPTCLYAGCFLGLVSTAMLRGS